MSEHIHEQISAFLDDELSSEESAFLVRRLTSDTIAHQQTVRYAAIGSVLRDERLLANSAILRERIRAVLDGAPISQSVVHAHSKRPTRWAKMIAGASVAASVAVISLFGLRTIVDIDSSPVRSATIVSGVWTEPGSYVVPGESTPTAPGVVAPPIRLTNLLMQHGQFTSTLNRTSVQSNVISKHEAEPAEEPADELQER